MPSSAPKAAPPAAPIATSYGQVIEYIQDRLYLAAYTHPPNEATPFPYQQQQQQQQQQQKPKASSSKHRSKSHQTPASSGPKVHPPVYFTIDDYLLYNRFFADFGPLHIGHLYRFAVHLHDMLSSPENTDRGIVFWSTADPRARANAACLLVCYMILIQSWPPHLALAPIAQIDPPLMPFRDAGYSQADYGLTIQDVAYGVWKARESGLCALTNFSLEEYERFERVDMGDFNWITPQFLAFASPQHKPVAPVPTTSPEFALLPRTPEAVMKSQLPDPFKNILCHFKERNIGLVVRLNSELYSPSYFTALGIEHIDMIFDDGTCPPLLLVRKFIKLAHVMTSRQKKNIAVHCKAGLGRTGCLIGAYLIYRHGFVANDLIAFMRFMRPGMVVGPQQHWLHINQGTFRQWWWEDVYREKLARMMPTTPTKQSRHHQHQHYTSPSHSSVTTPVHHRRPALGEINHNEGASTSRVDDCLPAPTPGQPRKAGRLNGIKGGRTNSTSFGIVEDASANGRPGSSGVAIAAGAGAGAPEAMEETVEMHSHRRSRQQLGDNAESEEEWQLRRLSRRPSSPRSPGEKRRAVSYTTTTTTMTTTTSTVDGDTASARTPTRPSGSTSALDAAGILRKHGAGNEEGDVHSDVENWEPARQTAARHGADYQHYQEQHQDENQDHHQQYQKQEQQEQPHQYYTPPTSSSSSSSLLVDKTSKGAATAAATVRPIRPSGGTLAASPSKSGSGSGSIGVVKVRGSPLRRAGTESREMKTGGVRKTSGRVGSMAGAVTPAAAARS